MRARGKLLIAAAVLAFAAAALLWRASSALPPLDPAAASSGGAASPAAMARDAEPEARVPSTVAREELPRGAAAESARTAPELLFVGRCVAAEGGRPLAGVEVAFTPTWHLEARAGIAALRGEPEPAATRTTTSADGRFELPGNRARASVHMLTFEAAGRVRVEGVPHAEIAGRVELGDVPLPLGVVAHARVVDQQGQPQAGMEVEFHASEGTTITPWLRVRREFAARANADGTLSLPVMAPGQYGVGCDDRELVGPREWDVAPGALPFDVVVNGAPETITGVVFDALGAPIAEVAVQPAARERDSGAVPYTDANGRFVVVRWSTDRPDPHRLRLSKPGWRMLESEPIAWDTPGLRFTMAPAHSLEVQVVDAKSGAPVEEFGVRVASPRIVFHDLRMTEGVLRQVDRHPGGRVRVPLEDGPQRLWVQPGSGHAPSDPVDVVGGEAMPPQIVVRLEPLEPRTVRVVDGAGTPIAGSSVEVLRPGDAGAQDRGHAVLDDEDLQWRVWPRREGAPRPWLRLAEARTGADGTAALSVSPREELELRVEGPAHCPFVRRVVFAGEPDPLQVVVARGATLAGSIVPADFAVRMQALGGRNAAATAVRLLQRSDGHERWFPAADLPIGPDGEFRVEHVPPGTWQVVAECQIAGSGSMSTSLRLPLGASGELREGGTHELRLDASRLLPGTLRAHVVVNGEPWRSAKILVRGDVDVPVLPELAPAGGWRSETDGDGAFTLHRLPGRYRVVVNGVASAEVGVITPGGATEATFTIGFGTVVVRFVDANGEAVPAACAVLLSGDERPRLLAADAQGVVRVEHSPGAVRVGVLPAELRDGKARDAWVARYVDASTALRRAAEAVASVLVDAGEQAELRITVPAALGY